MNGLRIHLQKGRGIEVKAVVGALPLAQLDLGLVIYVY